jgi:hypothetical protein
MCRCNKRSQSAGRNGISYQVRFAEQVQLSAESFCPDIIKRNRYE